MYQLLVSHFNVVEQYKVNIKTLAFDGAHKQNLLMVNSFEGLPLSAPSSKVQYYLYGLKEPDDIAKNVYLEEDYQVTVDLQQNLNAKFIRNEVEKMNADANEILPKLGEDVRLRSEDDLIHALELSKTSVKVEAKSIEEPIKIENPTKSQTKSENKPLEPTAKESSIK